jgi:hypothetical protein
LGFHGGATMSDLRTAAQQALNALTTPIHEQPFGLKQNAVTAIRAALEQEEQEPVAWMYRGIGVVRFAEKLPSPGMHKTESVALYTTPPRREWVSLTDEEIKALLPGAVRVPPGWRETVAAVEAKLKEKNHG